MTKILDSLEKRLLVRRCTHPTDRRMLLVEITEAGMTVMDQLLPRLHRLEPGWLDVLSGLITSTALQGRMESLSGTIDMDMSQYSMVWTFRGKS